jgi:hypothetical protein
MGPASRSATLVAYKLQSASSLTGADENGLAPAPVSKPIGGITPEKAALLDLASGRNSPLPPGTRVIGFRIDSQKKLATVDFSPDFTRNFQGGETKEAQAVMSVLETLGQFQDIKKVQFLVSGRKIDSLGGSEELDEPLPTPQSTENIALASGSGGT